MSLQAQFHLTLGLLALQLMVIVSVIKGTGSGTSIPVANIYDFIFRSGMFRVKPTWSVYWLAKLTIRASASRQVVVLCKVREGIRVWSALSRN